MLKNNIEILSPAGDFESVVAAVQNGANAVYLGLKEFSARKNAKNFDKEELFNAVSYCHIRGVKVYLALNTVVSNKELDIVSNCIKIAVSCGVDAIIVQDFGVFSLIKKICPTMPLHASTQMTVHTVKGAVMLKELGFERVVLAREMS
ncbi:MAG: peptidase U32 family protein, partial [Oscillospiraceae bacterium]